MTIKFLFIVIKKMDIFANISRDIIITVCSIPNFLKKVRNGNKLIPTLNLG